LQGALSKNQRNVVRSPQPKLIATQKGDEEEKEEFNDTFLTQKKVEEQT